jgi:hypothetical protein
MFPFFKYKTFSLASKKSFYVIFILLSLRASKPAYHKVITTFFTSVHIALTSAPVNSSLELTNDSILTSSAKDILPDIIKINQSLV